MSWILNSNLKDVWEKMEWRMLFKVFLTFWGKVKKNCKCNDGPGQWWSQHTNKQINICSDVIIANTIKMFNIIIDEDL